MLCTNTFQLDSLAEPLACLHLWYYRQLVLWAFRPPSLTDPLSSLRLLSIRQLVVRAVIPDVRACTHLWSIRRVRQHLTSARDTAGNKWFLRRILPALQRRFTTLNLSSFVYLSVIIFGSVPDFYLSLRMWYFCIYICIVLPLLLGEKKSNVAINCHCYRRAIMCPILHMNIYNDLPRMIVRVPVYFVQKPNMDITETKPQMSVCSKRICICPSNIIIFSRERGRWNSFACNKRDYP